MEEPWSHDLPSVTPLTFKGLAFWMTVWCPSFRSESCLPKEKLGDEAGLERTAASPPFTSVWLCNPEKLMIKPEVLVLCWETPRSVGCCHAL